MIASLGMLGEDAAMFAGALFIVAALASLVSGTICDHPEHARRA